MPKNIFLDIYLFASGRITRQTRNYYSHRMRRVVSFKHALREGFKKKSKNMMEFSIIGLTPPSTPMMENFSVKSQSGGPPQGEKFFYAFLHHLEPRQKKVF